MVFLAKCVVMFAITLIVAEFGVHVIYYAKTGKAGVNDPAFSYLIDLKSLLIRKRYSQHICIAQKGEIM